MKNKLFIVNPEESIDSAIQKILLNEHRAVMVVKKNKLLGIVSEGDILKALIYKKKLNSKVENIMNRSYKFLNGYNREKAQKIFSKYLVSFVPIVNNKMEIKKIITLEEFLKEI